MARSGVERGQECEPGVMPSLGSEGVVSRVLWFILYWLIYGMRVGVREQEGRSGITHTVDYFDHPGLS